MYGLDSSESRFSGHRDIDQRHKRSAKKFSNIISYNALIEICGLHSIATMLAT